MSARPGAQREQQLARLEVSAADRVDHGEALRRDLQDVEPQDLRICDLGAMPLLEAEPAQPQQEAMAEQGHQGAARRGGRTDPDLGE